MTPPSISIHQLREAGATYWLQEGGVPGEPGDLKVWLKEELVMWIELPVEENTKGVVKGKYEWQLSMLVRPRKGTGLGMTRMRHHQGYWQNSDGRLSIPLHRTPACEIGTLAGA